jgi:hypothetical protein
MAEIHSCCPGAGHPYFWIALSPDSAGRYILYLAGAKNVNAYFGPPMKYHDGCRLISPHFSPSAHILAKLQTMLSDGRRSHHFNHPHKTAVCIYINRPLAD